MLRNMKLKSQCDKYIWTRHEWDIIETGMGHYWDRNGTLLRQEWDIIKKGMGHYWDRNGTLLRQEWDFIETGMGLYWDREEMVRHGLT